MVPVAYPYADLKGFNQIAEKKHEFGNHNRRKTGMETSDRDSKGWDLLGSWLVLSTYEKL